jgi:hypothetical protein
MPIIIILATFALCFAVDKGFTKVFRGKKQHQSGLSVKLNKKYGLVGIVLGVLGIAAVFAGLRESSTLLLVGGGIIIAMGIALVVYYMTFGIFYDDESFILTTFGRRSTAYEYRQIKCQQLYNAYGAILIELQMEDGRAVQLQAGMEGVYPFLDKAFAAWLRQTGRRREDCSFHDPDNSCWFPSAEA